jgi:hypothetical protein
MKKSLILSDQEREARNRLVKENRLKRGKIITYPYDDWVCITYTIENFQATFLCAKTEKEKILEKRLSTEISLEINIELSPAFH